jgi:hypothetical protein
MLSPANGQNPETILSTFIPHKQLHSASFLKLPSYALIIGLPGGFSTIILNLFLNLPIPAARWDRILPDLGILPLLDDLYNRWSSLFCNILLVNCSVPCFYFRVCPENVYVKSTCTFVFYITNEMQLIQCSFLQKSMTIPKAAYTGL